MWTFTAGLADTAYNRDLEGKSAIQCPLFKMDVSVQIFNQIWPFVKLLITTYYWGDQIHVNCQDQDLTCSQILSTKWIGGKFWSLSQYHKHPLMYGQRGKAVWLECHFWMLPCWAPRHSDRLVIGVSQLTIQHSCFWHNVATNGLNKWAGPRISASMLGFVKIYFTLCIKFCLTAYGAINGGTLEKWPHSWHSLQCYCDYATTQGNPIQIHVHKSDACCK